MQKLTSGKNRTLRKNTQVREDNNNNTFVEVHSAVASEAQALDGITP